MKAFDTSNHELLFALLVKYRAPPPFVSVVHRLYENNTLELRIGKAKWEILYSVGVKQGDNMAGVLFLFLIQAMAESLADHWDVETPKFHFHDNTGRDRPLGRLIGQSWK